MQTIVLGALLTSIICLCILVHHGYQRVGRPSTFPPGPMRFPLIGSALEMPRDSVWLKAAEWRNKYGDLVFLQGFGRSYAFVNSYEIAVDLLQRRSAIYSSRPTFTMSCELIGWDWAVAFMPFGKTWQQHSAIICRLTDSAASERFIHVNINESHKLLYKLFQSPESFYQGIKDYVSSSILMITYGHEVKDENDSYLTLAERGVLAVLDSAVPGKYLVDLISWLKYVPRWFPGATFQKIAAEARTISHDVRWVPYNDTKAKFIAGTTLPSLESTLLETYTDANGDIADEDVIAGITGNTYAAGADTANSVILSFILAMSLYPDVQRRAQEEIDRVVGKERLPGFQDRASLPYISALINECLRWQPVAPLGGPHELIEDDVYNGHLLPKGTMIIPNQWLFMHDPNVYPDPSVFRPERFFDPKGEGMEKPQRDPKKIAFGFGRRICPGRYLALNIVYGAVVSILATYDIRNPTDLNGEPLTGPVEYTTGLTVRPLPFKCTITARSDAHLSLVRGANDFAA